MNGIATAMIATLIAKGATLLLEYARQQRIERPAAYESGVGGGSGRS